MTTDMQQEATDAAETTVQTADAAAVDADASAEVLARARFEAFGLVTEARKEAESIIDEAKTQATDIVREAEMTAESIRDAARLDATEVRAERGDEADSVTADAVASLEAEHQELEDRVGSLRDLADQLEHRFAQLAADADESPTPKASTTTVASEAAAEVSEAPVMDYSPSVEPPAPQADVEESEDAGPAEKGSFYSRRSAKLPRIGDAGGKSALDMMRSIRATLDDDG